MHLRLDIFLAIATARMFWSNAVKMAERKAQLNAPLGWVDFDPTNDCVVGEDHVTLAWGRDFGDVSPLRGMIIGGGRHKLAVDVGVRRIG